MKKIAFVIVALLMSVAANAQFEKGKGYLGASLSGLDLSSQAKHFHFGFDIKAGYLFADNLMGLAQLGYENTVKKDGRYATFLLSAGGRYYIQQNGLYLGVSAIFKHLGKKCDDFLPSVQVGYSFFVNRTVTIEPEIYYEQSFKNHKDYSTIGLRVGIGIYLFKDTYKNIVK